MPAEQQETRYDVFISYRRESASDQALLLRTELQQKGLAVFMDLDLRHGVFDETLLRHIAEAPAFLIVLTPGSLDRCSDEEDWLRREIVLAIRTGRNIIPVTDSFRFTADLVKHLDPSIREIARYVEVEYSRTYIESAIERIVERIEQDKAKRSRAQAKREAEDRWPATERADVANDRRKPALQGMLRGLRALNESPIRPALRKVFWTSAFATLLIGIAAVGWRHFMRQKDMQQMEDKKPPPVPNPGNARTNPKDDLNYVWIPPGAFQMGCLEGDNECDDDEKPAHPVTITKGFWMGQTEVTQAAYQNAIGSNPSYYRGPQLPVQGVRWTEAKGYCAATGGRLPTEAEWEYAARAGSVAARYGKLDDIAWYGKNSDGKTHAVAQKAPNAWKLYDMLGNVWEWTGDWYDANYYKQWPRMGPKGPQSGEWPALRGGSWYGPPSRLRAAARGKDDPNNKAGLFGFRCVLEVLP